MNTLSTILLSYAELGLILTLAYLLFRGVRGVLQDRIDSAAMIRVGRTLFAAMLISPLIAHCLLSFRSRGPMAIGGGSATTVDELATLLQGISGLISRQFSAPEGAPAGSLLSQMSPALLHNVTVIFACTLCVGLTLALWQTSRRVRELREVIRGAVPFRTLGRVSIVVSDRVSVPFSTAIFGRAHVVLPVGLLRDSLLLRVTVRHELQHYRRLDPWWAVALELFRALYFWNPAARGWTRELSDLQELACDEAVIRRGVPAGDYGKCLIRVAEMAVATRFVASTAMATVSDRGVHLRRRIDMLFLKKTKRRSLAWVLGSVAISSVLLVLVATTAAANWPAVGYFAAPAAAPLAPAGAGTHDAPAADCEDTECVEIVEKPVAEVLPDLEFRDPDGAVVSLSGLEGKVVVVEFWAAWCKFCQREVTQMKELHERLAGSDFEMVGVSLSRTPEETQQFIEDYGVVWPQMHAEDGWQSEASQAFAVQAVPSRYLIDRNGQVTSLPRGNLRRTAAMIMQALEGGEVITSAAR